MNIETSFCLSNKCAEHYWVVFDSAAARAYAEIAAARRQAGRPIHTCDAQIADITRSHRATLATRNVADFENCGIILINPWT